MPEIQTPARTFTRRSMDHMKRNIVEPLVRYRDETSAVACPYGEATRIITGGEGGVANVHVIRVTRGDSHYHSGYHEVYYVLSGNGEIVLEGNQHKLRPGAVVIIPYGIAHEVSADEGEILEFVIVGSPAMAIDDPRFVPRT